MSKSKVPQIDRLPDGLAGWVCRYQVLTPHGWIGAWAKEAIEWYGDARAAEGRRRDARDVGSDVHGLLIVPAGTLGMDMGGGCSEKDNVACA